MKTIFYIAKVNILDVFRDMKANGIVFILPVVFIVIFGFLFNQTTNDTSFDIAVTNEINEDHSDIVTVLKEIKNEEELLFNITSFESKEEIVSDIKEGGADVGLVVGEQSQFEVLINESNQRSLIARSILSEVIYPVPGELLSSSSVVEREDVSIFELQIAGLVVYGILIMIPQVAGSLSKIKEKKYIFRYSLSKATSFEILSGFTLSSLFVGIIQAVLLFYVSTWFGLNIDKYTLFAFIFILPLVLFSIGAGLLIGSASPKSESAQNTGTILSIILGFLSGSFIVGIDRIGATIGGRFLSITDIVPTFYATDGITQLIIFNVDMGEVLKQFAVITLSAVLLFIIGVFLFNKKTLRA